MARTLLDLLYDEAPREDFDRFLEAAGEDPGARRGYDVALRLRELIARQRSREAELSALYATASDLTAIRDVNAVLAAIVRRARQLLKADMTYLSLNDEGEGASYMKVTDGALSAEFRTLRLPLGTGLLGLVAQTGAPYFTDDYQSDERFVHRGFVDDAVADEGIRAILGVPLVLEGRVIGALLATHRTVRPFPPEEVSLLTSFAAHATVALENARLFAELDEANARLRGQAEAVEEAARAHDQLTGLLLHRSTLAEVVGVLAEVLGGGAVSVLDADGHLLAGDEAPGPGRAALDRAVASGRSVALEDGYLAPALAGQEHLATVVVRRGTRAGPRRAAHPGAGCDRRRPGPAVRPLRRRGGGAAGRRAAHRPDRGQRRRSRPAATACPGPAAAPGRRLRGRGRRGAGGRAPPRGAQRGPARPRRRGAGRRAPRSPGAAGPGPRRPAEHGGAAPGGPGRGLRRTRDPRRGPGARARHRRRAAGGVRRGAALPGGAAGARAHRGERAIPPPWA